MPKREGDQIVGYEVRPTRVLDLIENREAIEDTIEDQIKREARKAGVEIREIRLGEPAIPPEILIGRQRVQLADQLGQAYIRETEAQKQRIETEQARSTADEQPRLVAAQIAVQVAEQREAERAALGRAERKYLEEIAMGQKAQTEVLGQDRVTMLQALDKALISLERQPQLVQLVGKLVPNTVVNGSGLEGAAAILGNAFGGASKKDDTQVPPGSGQWISQDWMDARWAGQPAHGDREGRALNFPPSAGLTRRSRLVRHSVWLALRYGALATPTRAGRSSRSPIEKPARITSMMVPGGWSLDGNLEHRLVQIGVEFLALGVDPLDAVAFEDIEQFAIGHLDARHQILHRFGGILDGVGMGEFERFRHIVADREDVAGEIGRGIKRRLRFFALGTLAQVFHLGKRPQQAVLELAYLLLEDGDFGIARIGAGGSAVQGAVVQRVEISGIGFVVPCGHGSPRRVKIQGIARDISPRRAKIKRLAARSPGRCNPPSARCAHS